MQLLLTLPFTRTEPKINRKAPYKNVQSILESLTRENKASLDTMQNERRLTLRVFAQNDFANNFPKGIEGELAVDEEAVLWVYDTGIWRPCCTYTTGPTIGLGTISFHGLEPIDGWTEIYTLDPTVPDVATRIVEMAPDESYWWGQTGTVWNEDQTKLYASKQDYDTGEFQIIEMGPTGEDQTLIMIVPDVGANNVVQPIISIIGSTVYFSYTYQFTDEARTFNVTDDTQLGVIPASLVSGSSAVYLGAMHPTEERYLAFFFDAPAYGWYSINADGTDLFGPICSPVPVYIGSADWHPSGNLIAYPNYESGPNGWAVHMVNADGTDDERLLGFSDDSSRVSPRWSPDGSKLVFGSENGQVFFFNEDGSGPYLTVDQSGIWSRIQSYDWTKDSSHVIVNDDNYPIGSRLYLVDATTGEVTTLYDQPPGSFDFIENVLCASKNSYAG